MPIIGTPVARVAGDANNPVVAELKASPSSKGYGLRRTQYGLNAAGAPPVVAVDRNFSVFFPPRVFLESFQTRGMLIHQL